ncbi:MAG: sodium:calcium antiporter, partial [Thiobacillaceae bacterium]
MRELPSADVAPVRYAAMTLRRATVGYTVAAGVVVAAGIWLPMVAKALAWQNGLAESFVGTLFVAAVTSAPEAVVSIAAVRLGALDMALGNLFGSNLFNIAILALDDIAYTPGPLLSAVDPTHAVSALSAMVMSGIAIIGLFYRARGRVLRTVGWASLFLLAVYLFNGYALYLYAH